MVNLTYKRDKSDDIWKNGIREASLYTSEDWTKETRYTSFEDITKLVHDVYKK